MKKPRHLPFRHRGFLIKKRRPAHRQNLRHYVAPGVRFWLHPDHRQEKVMREHVRVRDLIMAWKVNPKRSTLSSTLPARECAETGAG